MTDPERPHAVAADAAAAVEAPDPAMMLLGRALLVVADVAEHGLPADGSMPAGVDLTVAALAEWVTALARTAAYLATVAGVPLPLLRPAGQELIDQSGVQS